MVTIWLTNGSFTASACVLGNTVASRHSRSYFSDCPVEGRGQLARHDQSRLYRYEDGVPGSGVAPPAYPIIIWPAWQFSGIGVWDTVGPAMRIPRAPSLNSVDERARRHGATQVLDVVGRSGSQRSPSAGGVRHGAEALQLGSLPAHGQRRGLHQVDAGEPGRGPALFARTLRPLPEHGRARRSMGGAQQ